MSVSYSDAYKEALLYVPNDNPRLETLSFEHEDIPSTYIVKDYQGLTAYLEDLVTEVTFTAGFFDIKIPDKNASGLHELSITVGNADGSTFAKLESIKLSEKPLFLVYREYLLDNLTTPAIMPPLRLQARVANVGRLRASLKGVFARDMKNTMVPKERYTRARFPGLGQ